MIGTLILGAGAGGLGPLVYAARHGLLDGWRRQGLTVIERRHEPRSALGRYALLADSFAPSFLEGLDGPAPHPLLGRARESDEGRALLRFADVRPPLPVVGAFLQRLEAEMEAALGGFARGREVRSLHLRPDHVEVEVTRGDAGTRERLEAKTVILALGGTPLASGDPWASDQLLTEEGIERALAEHGPLVRAARPEVVIVGGSHSAFSAAWLLVRQAAAGLFADGAIALVMPRAPAIFYRSAADAESDGYRAFTVDDICPRTGRVHQLGGLRGDGRELWRRISRRPGTTFEPRIRLLERERDGVEIEERLARATIVVPATGYAPARVPTFSRGDAIALRTARPSVDDRCRVLTASGAPLERVFSLGMASGFVPSGSMGGEPSFRGHTNGVWLYQHHLGQRVYEGVQSVLAGAAS